MSNYPEIAINDYVWEQFRLDSLLSPSAAYLEHFSYASYDVKPFFPIDDIMAGDTAWGNKTHVVYDSMIAPRSTRKYFYPIKSGKLMYTIKGPLDQVFEWRAFISDILDREDAAAADINEFSAQSQQVRFHCLSVSQVNWLNMSYKDQPTQRKDFTASLIVAYDYHPAKIYNA